MMWDYNGMWNWHWMGGLMLLFWGAVIVMAIWGIRAYSVSRHSGDRALAMLRSRLAAGEISQADFDRIRRTLQG